MCAWIWDVGRCWILEEGKKLDSEGLKNQASLGFVWTNFFISTFRREK